MATAVQLTLNLDAGGSLSILDRLKQKWQEFKHDLLGGASQITPALGKAAEGFNGIESAERRAHIAGQLFTRTLGVEIPRSLETVIARSRLLGPLLMGFFNVSVFAAGGAAILGVAHKIAEASKEAEQHREAWIEIGGTVQDTSLKIIDELDKEKKKYVEITQGPIAAMKFEIASMRSVAISAFQDIAHEMQMVSEQFAKEGGFFGKGPINDQVSDNVKRVLSDMNLAMHNAAAQNPKDLLAPLIAEQTELQKAIGDTQTLIKNRSANMGADKSLLEPLQKELSFYVQINSQIETQIELQKQKSKTAGQDLVETQRKAYDQVVTLQHQVDAERLGGIAKIRAEENAAIEEVIRNVKDKGVALAQIALIHQQAADKEKQAELEMGFSIREAQLFSEQRAASFLTGSEKIVAEADYEKDVLLFNLQKYLTSAKHTVEEVQAAWDAFHIREAAIDRATNEAKARNAEQMGKALADVAERQSDAEQAAALATMGDWQRTYAQLAIEEQNRIRHIDQQERELRLAFKDDATALIKIETSAQAQREAVIAETNEKIRQEYKRQVQQLGSDLESVFNDIAGGKIGQRILANMKKLFFEILAQWLLTTKSMGSAFGNIFGTLVFGPGSMESQMGQGGGLLGGAGLLGGLFGSSGAGVPSGTAPGAQLAAAGGGSPAAGASGATTDPFTNSLFGIGAGAGTGNPLTTQSLAAAGISGGGIPGIAGGFLGAGKGGLKSLFSSPQGIAGLGGMLLALTGGKIGGMPGQIGGMLTMLSIMSQSNPAIGAMLSHLGLGGGLAGTLLAAAGPALLGFGIGTHFGRLGGALAGGGVGFGAGALIGLAGGPIGAIVGGIIGALAGLFGGIFGSSKRRKQANSYAEQAHKQIQQIVQQYMSFQLTSDAAISQLEQFRTQAESDLKKLKGEGKKVFNTRIGPDIDAAEKQIRSNDVERQRRASLMFGPPQFHEGGYVNAQMSAYTTRPGELLALIRHGEFVMNPRATAQNLPALMAMNAGGRVGGTIVVQGPLVQASSVDEKWLRNGGAQKIADALWRRTQEGH